MDKSYNPKDVEVKWYSYWLDNDLHRSVADAGKEPFSIVIPPPNVTGSLHIGHALNNTLQDILTRYKKMCGFDVLWLPGTDHAGIATQLMVERKLQDEGVSKYDLGRDEFIKKVWEWKNESGGKIIKQLQRLGTLPDWSRERFTLDEGLSRAVTKVFVDLYNEGLIYRDKRLVNWDPELCTAISDLEVEQKEVEGNYWFIRYPLEKSDRYIVVATTRPETMLGDTAVAVHPADPRYSDLIGEFVILPLCGRKIPVIGDEYSDPEKGSGAVKITPAHDFNDFEVGKRHNLEMINIFDQKGYLNDNVPEDYRGIERFEARKRIVKDLEDQGLLIKVEGTLHSVPYGDRSGVVVEPYLTDQWYVNAEALAGPAIDVVEKGEVNFYPKFWENTYLEWMRNIEPWCISRQLWWGHRIPAWYGPDGSIFVDYDESGAIEKAKEHYGTEFELTRDPDVLDTWFSSGLWPFSTMGWPEDTTDLRHYFPTDTLVTAFDIIFFWVARMIMLSLKFTGKSPFRDIYIHGLIRDESGNKMSKTKGNVIDPLDVIEKYGADSLRFTLAALSTQGRDIKLSYPVIEGYRNFMNKIWNASRFIVMNLDPEGRYSTEIRSEELNSVDKWILTRMNQTLERIESDYRNYEFDKVAGALYHFIWHDFCDWYIELSKESLYGSDDKRRDSTCTVLIRVLIDSLKALHPICPHITEEIFNILSGYSIEETETDGVRSIIKKPYPEYNKQHVFPAVTEEMDFVKETVSGIRNLRALINIHPSEKIEVVIRAENEKFEKLIEKYRKQIVTMAATEKLNIVNRTGNVPERALSHIVSGAEIFLPVEGLKDIDNEIKRIQKDLDKVVKEIGRTEGKLKNQDFLKNAPQNVIEKERSKYEEFSFQKERLEEVKRKLEGI